jgi:hypothetical protein
MPRRLMSGKLISRKLLHSAWVDVSHNTDIRIRVDGGPKPRLVRVPPSARWRRHLIITVRSKKVFTN